MSTLSELIPSGGTQNNIEFVAQGTLANGQTVGLRSDGKVEAVGESAVAENMGAIAEYATGTVGYLSVAFNVADGKYVFAYIDFAASGKLYAVVGTPSGTDITFGTPLEISGAGSYGYLQAVYDANAQKVVLGSNNNNGYFQIVVLTISGTGLTKGTAAVPFSSSSGYVCGVYHETAQKCVFINSWGSLNNTKVHIATVSGTGVTINSSTNVPNETTINYLSAAYVNTATPRVLFIGKSSNNSDYTRGFTFTVSGTTPTFNSSPANINNNTNAGSSCVYNSQGQRGICFFVVGSTVYGRSIEINGSGDLISLGTQKTISSGAPNYNLTNNSSVYDPLGYLTYLTYYAGAAVNRLELIKISYSSNTLTIEGGSAISTSGTEVGIGYDPTNKQIGVSFKNGNDGDDGYGRVYTIAGTSTNATSFVGITNAAISSGATGEVAVKGGLSTGGNLLPLAPSFGTASAFSAANTTKTAVVFDSSSNKIVVVYNNPSDSLYGTAVVGTVSGSSITYGSPVRFRNTSISYPTATFDPTTNKVYVVSTNDLNSNRLEAIVGTISGTSISFGSSIRLNVNNGATYASSAFDVNANSLVVCWKNTSNSNYGTAAVGAYNSGTGQLNFGTLVVFNSATTSACAAVYDSNSNKVVTGYQDSGNSGYGTAIVGTVSGTSISFGSEAVFESANSFLMAGTFDSNANKAVFTYQSGSKGKAVVGTVSGTSISFGSSVNFDDSSAADMSNSFDTSSNKVVICFRDTGNSQSGTVVFGTVSGTSISFAASSAFVGGTVANMSTTFDSNANKTIVTFVDGSDSTKGKALTITEANTLTIGSNYFVQDNGTLATTSSSTKAGKAISTTALNLVDPT